ncbi:MAG TPA: metallopeptidase family protein [Acidimicrobiales bacterium]|nr:metallopeptidase family protein [Acidimicrobiales bacterium]
MDVGEERFEELVADALDSIPEELGRLMHNVAVVVDHRSPPGTLFGLYQGVPLTERGDYGGMAMPDRITIFRRAICADCATEDEVVEQVRVTVVHEVAHHFGIDDDRLDELGWS